MRSSDPTNHRVLAFNLTSESFEEMLFPHGWRSYNNERVAPCLLSESFEEMLFPHGWRSYNNERVAPCLLNIDKSTIALVAFTFITREEFEEENSDVEHVLDIWVMKEYGDSESWTKLYSISSSLPRFEIPLSFWRKDKLLLQRADYRHRLICYDLFTGQVYEYEDCDPIFDSYDDLSSKGQLQNEPGHCGRGGPLGWGLHFVTGHQSFASLKQV